MESGWHTGRCATGKDGALHQWINRLMATRGVNKATVALTNKLIRIDWVIITRGENYCVRPSSAA